MEYKRGSFCNDESSCATVITMEDQVKLLMQRIQELQKERDNVPKHQVQVIESITEDINYYQNQIDFMVNEM